MVSFKKPESEKPEEPKGTKLLVGLKYDKHLACDCKPLDYAIDDLVKASGDLAAVQQLMYWTVALIRQMGAQSEVPFVIKLLDSDGFEAIRATVEFHEPDEADED